LQAFFFEVALIGMPLVCFCSLRVFRLLSQHVSITSIRLNKTPEEISDEKSILKAIIIQGLTPIIFALPTAFIMVMVALQGWDSPAVKLTIFTYGENQEYHYTMAYLFASIEALFPVIDPFITLLVVKIYRRAANQFLLKFRIYRKFATTTEEETSVSARANEHHAIPLATFNIIETL
jgi:hypothetical protein